MLTAHYESLGGIVSAQAYSDKWDELISRKTEAKCPFTGSPVAPRKEYVKGDGTHVNAHFFHLNPDSAIFDDRYCFDPEFMKKRDDGKTICAGESWQHRLGKEVALDSGKDMLRTNNAEGFYEYRIELPDKRLRIADVAFVYPSGYLIVVEIQLASITVDTLEERTKDYESVGASCYWWFGKNAATRSNLDWYANRFGVRPFIFDELSTC